MSRQSGAGHPDPEAIVVHPVVAVLAHHHGFGHHLKNILRHHALEALRVRRVTEMIEWQTKGGGADPFDIRLETDVGLLQRRKGTLVSSP